MKNDILKMDNKGNTQAVFNKGMMYFRNGDLTGLISYIDMLSIDNKYKFQVSILKTQIKKNLKTIPPERRKYVKGKDKLIKSVNIIKHKNSLFLPIYMFFTNDYIIPDYVRLDIRLNDDYIYTIYKNVNNAMVVITNHLNFYLNVNVGDKIRIYDIVPISESEYRNREKSAYEINKSKLNNNVNLGEREINANNANKNNKSRNLTYQEYINKYGVDSNSKAIIKLFFNKVSEEKVCDYKKLDKALSMYQLKNKINKELKQEIDELKKDEVLLTEEAYRNIIKATLKKIKQ